MTAKLSQIKVTPLLRAVVEKYARLHDVRLCVARRALLQAGARSLGLWPISERAKGEGVQEQP